jgi:hypothetical protein
VHDACRRAVLTDVQALLWARADQHRAQADRAYKDGRKGMARLNRVRASALGWAYGEIARGWR